MTDAVTLEEDALRGFGADRVREDGEVQVAQVVAVDALKVVHAVNASMPITDLLLENGRSAATALLVKWRRATTAAPRPRSDKNPAAPKIGRSAGGAR